jgi:hypothetical protein
MVPDFVSLENRMRQLERENRRLKRVVLATLLSVAPVALMAQVLAPRPIESRRFDLVDSDGTRARLDVINGAPVLVFYDGRGKARVKLGVDAKGAPTLTAILPSGRDIELLSEWPKARPLTNPEDDIPSATR